MRDVLLTNDDGIEADGLQALRRALAALDDVRLVVIAPDGNRFVHRDGSVGFATDGTPVDCVRLANLGLVDGFHADLVVSGINHGANLGDDITYSGTVAAALEGLILGVPGIAVSQQSRDGELDFSVTGNYDFALAADFVAGGYDVKHLVKLPPATLLNINVPGRVPEGVSVTHLGKRVYRDELRLDSEEEDGRHYWIYGTAPGYEDEPGSDLDALAHGRIALTPLHFDLTDRPGIAALERLDLGRLLAT